MDREKIFINSFVVVIFILCVLSTFIKMEEFNKLIYALIIPVFLVTILEFIIEIKEKAEKIAEEKYKMYDKLSGLENETAELKIENLKLRGKFDENNLPEDIQDEYEKSIEDCKVATNYIKVQTDLIRLKKPSKLIYTITLILFFLSIIFFDKVSSVLKNIDLNSISLWSLLLLLISIYYKECIATKLIEKWYKYHERSLKNKE